MPGLVELIATSGEQVDRVAEPLADAGPPSSHPAEAVGQIREARDLVAGRSRPMRRCSIRNVNSMASCRPAGLGERSATWCWPRTRPSCDRRAATGTVGTVTLRDGAIVEQDFVDTYGLSVQEGLPFVHPPDELTAYLLGEGQSWRLADANWSPDFPTMAGRQPTVRIEPARRTSTGSLPSRRTRSIACWRSPGRWRFRYGVTVQRRRDDDAPRRDPRHGRLDQGRKDVLDALAIETLNRCCPCRRSAGRGPGRAGGRQRAAVGLVSLATRTPGAGRGLGLDGRVRQVPGDYLYVVESNVAPTSSTTSSSTVPTHCRDLDQTSTPPTNCDSTGRTGPGARKSPTIAAEVLHQRGGLYGPTCGP